MRVKFFPPKSAEDDVCVGRILPYESHHGEGYTVQSVLSARVGVYWRSGNTRIDEGAMRDAE